MPRAGDRAGSANAFLLSWAANTLHRGLGRSSPLDARSYEIFGQGSRVNDTYLEQTSDIDLVLMLRAPLAPGPDDVDRLGTGYAGEWLGAGRDRWEAFRDDVIAGLGESYPVRMGRRCLNVDDRDSLFGEMVDILVAVEYRLYDPSPGPGPGRYEQGVFFCDSEGRPIVNFPKQHRRNGAEKETATGGRFKAVVRSMKRARLIAKRERMIADGAAPSYLLECLLYNVPDEVYRNLPGAGGYRDVLDWLRRYHLEEPVRFAELPCQNGINQIFGPGPDQWTVGDAVELVEVLLGLTPRRVLPA